MITINSLFYAYCMKPPKIKAKQCHTCVAASCACSGFSGRLTRPSCTLVLNGLPSSIVLMNVILVIIFIYLCISLLDCQCDPEEIEQDGIFFFV